MCKLQSLSSNSVQQCGGVNIRCLKLFQCSRSRSKNTPVRSVPVHCPLFLLATKKTDRQFHRPLVAVTSFIRSGHSHGRSRWYCETWSAPSCFGHGLSLRLRSPKQLYSSITCFRISCYLIARTFSFKTIYVFFLVRFSLSCFTLKQHKNRFFFVFIIYKSHSCVPEKY